MTGTWQERLAALRAVLDLFPDSDNQPPPLDVIAYAEWVADGSVSAATALEGQKHALYAQHRRQEPT